MAENSRFAEVSVRFFNTIFCPTSWFILAGYHAVEKRIEFKILLYMYKVVNGMAPTYLEERLDLYRPGRSLRSENTEL